MDNGVSIQFTKKYQRLNIIEIFTIRKKTEYVTIAF